MATYTECLYSLAHAFKVFCYHRRSWTWDEYCLWTHILDTAQGSRFRQEVAS